MKFWSGVGGMGVLLLAVVVGAMCYPEVWQVGMAGIMGFLMAYLLAKK